MKYSFETALVYLKRGYKIRRTHWFDGIYLKIQKGKPCRFWKGAPLDVEICPDGKDSLSLVDILAEDWIVVDNEG